MICLQYSCPGSDPLPVAFWILDDPLAVLPDFSATFGVGAIQVRSAQAVEIGMILFDFAQVVFHPLRLINPFFLLFAGIPAAVQLQQPRDFLRPRQFVVRVDLAHPCTTGLDSFVLAVLPRFLCRRWITWKLTREGGGTGSIRPGIHR